MDFLKIIYKDKEYTLEELISESNELLKGLTVPIEFQFQNSIIGWCLINDKGYAVAGEKFKDLYSVIASARFALLNAHTKIHKHNISWQSGYPAQLWLRSQYLQNSILWYNSCEDYILQIIYFAFDFYSDLKQYKKEMKKCRFDNICKKLDKYDHLPNTHILYNNLLSYHNDPSVKIIRDYADLTKHNQLLKFHGLDSNLPLYYNTHDFTTKDIEPKKIDIDETVDVLKDVHQKIISLGLFLLKFIEFENMFEHDTEGSRIFNETRSRKEFKKLIINEDYAT